MAFGSGNYKYDVVQGWGALPVGWKWGWIPAVGCDSLDRVFVYSRSEHPLVIFDREGNLTGEWGYGTLKDPHGIWIDDDDNVYCTERESHCMHKFNRNGQLVMTLGTPGELCAVEGEPFNLPTDTAVSSTGELFVSDGYGNKRVHKFSPEGEFLLSWGEAGEGPGQFALSHCVRIDKNDHVWICDRENDRIQIFDTDGNFLSEWRDLKMPATIYFDPNEDVVYIAECRGQVSIYTMDRELITQWGGCKKSETPGEFLGAPHGIWMDSHNDLYVGEVAVDGRIQKFARV